MKKLFLFIVLSLNVPNLYAISSDSPDIKALEILIQANQIFIALASACLAYLLHHGKEVRIIFSEGKDLAKVSILLSFFSLLILACWHVWDLFTISNQLRNDSIKFEDFFDDKINLFFLSVGLATFIYSAWVISGEKK